MTVNPTLVAAEMLQAVLIAAATTNDKDGLAYSRLRSRFMADPATRPLLPDFVVACRDIEQFWAYIQPKLGKYRERRSFLWDAMRPLIDAAEAGFASPAQEVASEALAKLDAEHVRRHWKKTLDRVQDDPDGAITSARALVESVCKLILDAQAITYDAGQDLNKLYRQAARTLKLGASDHDQQVFKQILTGCASVIEGFASVRNSLGDAHGQGANPVAPAPRHAQLAVNLAGAMATFLLETFETRHGVALHALESPDF